MAIKNYQQPQLEVYQQLEAAMAATGDHLAACVVGANYDLYRYGYEDLPAHTFDAAGETIAYGYETEPTLDYKVDVESVAVFAEGLQAVVVTDTTAKPDAKDPYVLRIPAGLDSLTYTPQVGDVINATYTYGSAVPAGTPTEVKNLVITDIVGTEVAAQATPTNGAALTVTVTDATKYAGAKATTILISCVSATASAVTITVSDSAGLITAYTTSLSGTGSTGVDIEILGMTVKVKWSATTTPDQAYISCDPATVSTTEFDGIKCDKLPVPYAAWVVAKTEDTAIATSSCAICKSFTGDIASNAGAVTAGGAAAWTATETGVTVESGLSLAVTMKSGAQELKPFTTEVGSLYVEYRVQIIPSADEDVFEISSKEDIESIFGTIAMENELAYGCYLALNGAKGAADQVDTMDVQGRSIYAIRVRSTDASGYAEAVKKTESNTGVYNFCPVTEDKAAIDAVVDFNAEMSAPDVKKWRVTRVGVDFPGEYDLTSFDADSTPLQATFMPGYVYNGYTGVLLSTTSNIDFTAISVNGVETSLHAGDKVRAVSGTYVIRRVLSATTLLLESGPANGAATPIAITLVKADTAENKKEYITNMAKSLNTRRAVVVYSDNARATDVDGKVRVVPNKFLACEVAGLASATLPQKSLTHTQVTGVTAAPRMYTQYTQQQLNGIAAEGVMLITQDAKGTPCYIRHQLTTETNYGPLYYEDSCTRNLDNISYKVVEKCTGFIGHANVTVPALRKLHAQLAAMLTEFTQDTTDELVGPSLVNFTDLQVFQDPVFKDRVIVKVKLYLPMPLNNIKVYEMAYAATVTL